MVNLWRAGRRHWQVVLLCLIGLFERITWTMLRPELGSGSEAQRVAEAIAAGRGFADAYRVGQGPTAHLLPISPSIGGAAYWLFGTHSFAAETVLTSWSIGLNIATYLLLYRAFRHLGVPRWMRLVGLGWGMIAVVYFAPVIDAFRVWEGGLANCLAALFLERLLARRATIVAIPRAARRSPLWIAACASLVFFVNPPIGLAAFACLLVFGMCYVPMRQNVIGAAVAVAVLAAFIVPWTIRNAGAVGVPVPLRSNAGLELAIGNNPDLAARGEHAAFLPILAKIHPTVSDAAYHEVQRIGEVAYANKMGAEATAWIAANPAAAAGLWIDHFKEFFLPSRWKFDESGTSKAGLVKALIVQGTSLLALLGAAVLVARRTPGVVYPVLVVLLMAVLMSPFVIVPRYSCLGFPYLCFFAASALLVFQRPGRGARPLPA